MDGVVQFVKTKNSLEICTQTFQKVFVCSSHTISTYIMKIIPQETYKLYSSLPVSELEFKFSDFFERESYKVFWIKYTGHSTFPLKTFYASYSHSFSFLSYKPKIKGEIKRIADDKTEVLIIAKMNKNTKVVFIVWLCIMIFFVVPSLSLVIMEFVYRESQIWTIIPILLFVIGYVAVSFAFYKKSKLMKNKLIEFLD